MDFSGVIRGIRQVIRQDFTYDTIAVGTSPTQLSPTLTLQSLITTFVIANNSGSSIFMGDTNVTTTNGFEIFTGSSPEFNIENYRQPYELQGPLLGLQQSVQQCVANADAIPFVVWDPSTIYLVAAAGVTVSVLFFKEMFV